jgi:transcriptional regulator with PAS, ATPase and Fis domain
MKSIEMKEEIQKILELISGLLQVDILMVDEECRKIAGSGIYEYTFGIQSYNDAFFERAAYNKSTFLISEDRTLRRDRILNSTDELKSTIYLYHSIVIEDKPFGVVKCNASNDYAKRKFIVDMEKVTELIDEIFIRLIIQPAKIQSASQMLKIAALINIVNDPLIYTSTEGEIEMINERALSVFNLSSEHIGMSIKKVFENFNFKKSLNKKSNDKKESFSFINDEDNFTGLYWTKPVKVNQDTVGVVFCFDVITKTAEKLNKRNQRITFDDIYGKSDAINKAKDFASRVLKGTSTVLLNGESGTGKELFARAIHNTSDRSEGPFIPINCAAIPETLLESELFGYEEGSFTGAKKGGKLGKFEIANHGTIFLDEIGDLKFSLQSKILRVLQENVIEKIGSKESLPIDVRVIAATHEELHEMVEHGSFREDLFYRLSVIPIRIPPLRERRCDIMIIANKFLETYKAKLNKNIIGFDDAVVEKLCSYIWRGNVRELENVIECAVNMSNREYIHIEDLPLRFSDLTHRHKELFGCNDVEGITPIQDLENKEINKALDMFGHSKKGIVQASEALGISVATLYRRLKKIDETK